MRSDERPRSLNYGGAVSGQSDAVRIEPLYGPSLVLEPLRIGHAEEMAPLLDDPALHTFIGGRPEGVDELAKRYARQLMGHSADGAQQWLNWIVRRADTGQSIGTMQATIATATSPLPTKGSEDHLVAELAWVIARQHQHRGYAREAAQLMANWLRRKGVHVLVAHIRPDHQASAGVAHALGLVPTGVVVDGEVRWQG